MFLSQFDEIGCATGGVEGKADDRSYSAMSLWPSLDIYDGKPDGQVPEFCDLRVCVLKDVHCRLGVKTRAFHLGDYRRAHMGPGTDVPHDYFFVNGEVPPCRIPDYFVDAHSLGLHADRHWASSLFLLHVTTMAPTLPVLTADHKN